METYRFYCITVMLCVYLDMKLCEEYVERRTENGKIRGVIKEVLEGKFVEVFLGVPYARPPVGELRFEVRLYMYITLDRRQQHLKYVVSQREITSQLTNTSQFVFKNVRF